MHRTERLNSQSIYLELKHDTAFCTKHVVLRMAGEPDRLCVYLLSIITVNTETLFFYDLRGILLLFCLF